MKMNQTTKKINEFYNECKKFTYKYKRKKWIDFYDIETAFKLTLAYDISDYTTEILVRVKLSIESMQKEFKSKSMPLKALKILIKTARESTES